MQLKGCERLTLDHTEEASECLELCEACAQLASVLLKVSNDSIKLVKSCGNVSAGQLKC